MPASLQIACWTVAALLAAGAAYGALGRAFDGLYRRALAKPNARSSHVTPTPQGAGIVIVPVAVGIASVGLLATGEMLPGGALYTAIIGLAALALAGIGFADDTGSIGIVPRLAVQVAAVAAAVLLLPGEARALPDFVPLWAERALLIVAGVWFINLTNFMDGIDWISVAETIAIAAGIVLLAALGILPPACGWIAAALIGAMAGFAPWNAPPARLFLGDAGSLPVGFLLGVLLLHTAASHALAAAVILPLYYLADATVTLLRRAWRGDRVWVAHREHFYQRAVRGGFTVTATVATITLLNLTLTVLALASTRGGYWTAGIACALAVILVAAALGRFARGKRPAMTEKRR